MMIHKSTFIYKSVAAGRKITSLWQVVQKPKLDERHIEEKKNSRQNK